MIPGPCCPDTGPARLPGSTHGAPEMGSPDHAVLCTCLQTRYHHAVSETILSPGMVPEFSKLKQQLHAPSRLLLCQSHHYLLFSSGGPDSLAFGESQMSKLGLSPNFRLTLGLHEHLLLARTALCPRLWLPVCDHYLSNLDLDLNPTLPKVLDIEESYLHLFNDPEHYAAPFGSLKICNSVGQNVAGSRIFIVPEYRHTESSFIPTQEKHLCLEKAGGHHCTG